MRDIRFEGEVIVNSRNAGLPGRAVLVAVMLALACGPAKPVILYVPPSVTIDSAGSPRRTPKVVTPSRNFWEAMASLDTGFVIRHEATESQIGFAKALGLVMSGRQEEAATALNDIRIGSGDTLVSAASRIMMTAMLQYQDKWKILAELDSAGVHGNSTNAPFNRAGVELWASAFRKVKPREITFPARPVVLPLLESLSGTPMVQVTINGKEYAFWLDTGASMSIVSADVARECGMTPLIPDTLEVATTTGHVPAQAGQISGLQLGGIRISNSTALIVSNDKMQVRIGDNAGRPVVIQIDGVVGYDIISRMNVTIDYRNHRLTLAKPEMNTQMPRTGRNLFWVGTPIVRLVTSKGVPLHFNLDTGAQETYSTDGLLLKMKVRTFIGERRLIGGLAGVTTVHGRFVDEIHATMAGQPLVLRKLLVFAPAVTSFVSLDGILGSDIGKGGVVRIDATNGLFMLGSRVY